MTKDQGLYYKPSAAVHPRALVAATLPQYNTIPWGTRSKAQRFIKLGTGLRSETTAGSGVATKRKIFPGYRSSAIQLTVLTFCRRVSPPLKACGWKQVQLPKGCVVFRIAGDEHIGHETAICHFPPMLGLTADRRNLTALRYSSI